MKIQIDKNGYVENYVIVGESNVCNIEVEEPEGFSPDKFQAWKYDGEKLVYDMEQAQKIQNNYRKNEIRARREKECFSYVNRGTLWYNKLTPEQDIEFQNWYDAWLEAPETLIIPKKLEWLDSLTNKGVDINGKSK